MPVDPSPSSRERHLELLLAEYLQARELGREPDREELLARHPDLADDLAAFFANQAAFARLAAPLAATTPRPHQIDLDTVGLETRQLPGAGSLRSFGNYLLEGEIARGGMGVVFRARQLNLDRPVALKMILAGQLAAETDVQRFRTEAQAAATLDHPNIVSIYEVGEHQGQAYFSMRLVDGGSLAGWRGTPHEAVKIMATVARAIHHAHQHRILHRDLKPANILLDAAGVPHVTDFGLAKRVEGDSKITQSGSIVGTPSYMAPEQASGREDITTAVDVYSLGAVLYELLTDRPPFKGEGPLETLLDVIGKEPVPPRVLNPTLDRDLDTITMKCLEKDPLRRYGSAEALAEDLERWLAREPIQARPTGVFERTSKWVRRRPAVAVLTLALALVTAMSFVGIALGWNQAVRAEHTARNAEGVAQANAEAEGRARKREEEAKNAALEAQRLEALARQKEADARRREEDQRRKAEAERDARQRALERAEGLRLNAEAAAARHLDPTLAILLALESVSRTPHRLTFATLHEALRDCRELRTLSGVKAPARWGPGGKAIVSSAGAWDETGKSICKAAAWRSAQDHVSLSPDGTRAVSLMRGYQTVYYFDGKEPSRHVYTDRVAYLWDTRTGKDVLHLGKHRDGIVSARFSPDGKFIVTASLDQLAMIWDARSGQRLHTLAGHQCALHGAHFSPDGQRVLTITSGRNQSGMTEVWTAEEEKNPQSATARERDPGIVDRPSRNGESGSSSSSMTFLGENVVARVWDVRSGKQLVGLWKSGEEGGVRFTLPVFAWAHALREAKWLPDRVRGSLAKWIPAKVGGHPGNPTQAAYCPDGTLVALGFEQGLACVWEVSRGGRPRLEYRGHRGAVHAVAFTPDGKRLVTAGEDHTVRILDPQSGAMVQTLFGHEGPVRQLAFSPDGKKLLTGSDDRTARVWDLGTWENLVVLRGHQAPLKSVEFHPDGQRILTTAGDGTVRIWESRPTLAIGQVLRGHAGKLNSLAFSPDGQSLLTAGQDEIPRLWDAATGREKLRLGEKKRLGEVRSARFSPDGSRIVTTSRNTLIVERNSVVNPSAVHAWDARTGADLLALSEHRPGALGAEFSRDGKAILTISDGSVQLKVDSAMKGSFSQSQTGGAGLARLWDASTGKLLATIEQTERKDHWSISGNWMGVRLSPDGKVVLHKPESGEAFLLADASTGKTRARLVHERQRYTTPSYSGAFSPDGRLVFTTAGGSDIRLWEVASARPVLSIQELGHPVQFGAFSPDGSKLAIVAGKNVYIWDLYRRLQVCTLEGHEGQIRTLAFGADGKQIVTGADDHQAILWDASSGRTLSHYTGHTAPVTLVAIRPDGLLATGSDDGTARLWPSDLAALVRARVSRQLTTLERGRYGLDLPKAQLSPPVVLPAPGASIEPLLQGPPSLGPADLAAATKQLEGLRLPGPNRETGLLALRRDYPGTAQALAASELLAKLPSPLDRLDPARIPAQDRHPDSPKELVAIVGETRLRHTDTVQQILVSPNGWLVAAQSEGEIRLHDVQKGTTIGSLPGKLLGFLERTGRLVTHFEGQLRYWEVSRSGPRLERTIPHVEGAEAISSDGSHLVEVTSSRAIRLWRVENATVRLRASLKGHGEHFPRVRFSGTGRILATWAERDVARLWEIGPGKPREIGTLSGLRKSDPKVALSPSGNRLAATLENDRIQVWQISEGKVVPVTHTIVQDVWALAFSHDARTLAVGTGSGTRLTLLDASSIAFQRIGDLPGHAGWVHAVAFALDGSFLVSGGSDNILRVWDRTAKGGKPRFAPRGHTGPVAGLAFAPDRPILATSGHDETLRLWDFSSGEARQSSVRPSQWGPVAFTPEGRLLVTGAGSVWEVGQGDPKALPGLAGHAHRPFQISISAEGKRLLTGATGPLLRLWDRSGAGFREAFRLARIQDDVWANSVSLSPDGRLVALGHQSWQEKLYLWRVTATGFEPVPVPPVESRHVLFSPDGRTLATAGDRDVFLLDLSGPIPIQRAVLSGHALPGWGGIVRGLAFSPDGRWLASTGLDRRLIVWNATTGARHHEWTLPAVPEPVSFAQDGRHVAAGARNGAVYVFRMAR